MIYLDNAATTLRKPPQVIDAVVSAMGSFGNSARGTHEEALAASRVIYDTRCKLAALFGCKRPDHVAFTCNSTEALNIAAAAALAREVPKGMEPQVYLMSVMAIDFDSQDEAQYLHKLAQAMGLSPQVINQIHQQVGVQSLYS